LKLTTIKDKYLKPVNMKTNSIQQPNALLPFEEKLSIEYGKKIADYISKEWFNGTLIGAGCRFMGRYNWIEKNRLYTRGEQDTQQYKSILARQQKDLSYLNVDWRPINVSSKFIHIVANGISDDNYKVNVTASDRYSVMEKKSKILKHKANMMALPMLKKAKMLNGIDLIPKYVPESEEEILFHTEIKDRPKIEIGEEILIDHIKTINNWDNIKADCDKDIVENGIMCAQVYTDRINGVSLRYIDPAEAVHSYVKRNDFSDAFYYGYVESITLSDIKRESGFSDEVLRKIAKTYKNEQLIRDYTTCPMEEIIDIKINVLRFCWKTNKTIVYKKSIRKGEVVKVSKRKENFGTDEKTSKARLSEEYDTWLEGNYVIGTQELYGYKECGNIVFDELNKPRPPFVFRASAIYKNKLHSFGSDIMVICDQMQYASLKIQHLMSELKPDIVEIDLDGLAAISVDEKGEAKKDNWKEALAILNVKGVVLKKRVNMGEDGMKDTQAVKPSATAQGSALTILLNVWAHYYNMLREVTGINPARDGSLSEDALLGVSRMAELSSNTVTKHIVKAAIDFDIKICETISARVKSISTFPEGKAIMERYKRAVGKQNIDAMDAMENRDLHDFGFKVEAIPTVQEISEFKEDLKLAMQEGYIDVEDKIEAQYLARVSIKQANEYLKFKRRIKIKQKQEQEQITAQITTESNIASNKAASESKINEETVKAQIKVETELKLSRIRLSELAATNEINAPKEEKKFNQEVYLKQLEGVTQFDVKKYLEDRKDDRVQITSSNQSKMIDQRNNNLGPSTFGTPYDFSISD